MPLVASSFSRSARQARYSAFAEFVAPNEPPDPALKDLAKASGGGYFELKEEKDDLRATFARVIDELHRQYWLGFVPVTLDGKVHEIDVRVNQCVTSGENSSVVEMDAGICAQ